MNHNPPWQQKADTILSFVLRLLLFAYNLTLLYMAVFRLKNDKMFVIAICIFGILCTGTYLVDGFWKLAFGHSPKPLEHLIYGDGSVGGEEARTSFLQALKYVLFLMLLYLGIRLIGLFLSMFLVMALFPFLHSRKSLLISIPVSAVICYAFYSLYIQHLGIALPKGILFGF